MYIMIRLISDGLCLNYLDSACWSFSITGNFYPPVLQRTPMGGTKCFISVPLAAIDTMMIFKWTHLTSCPMNGAVRSAKQRRVHSEASTLITMKAMGDKAKRTHRRWDKRLKATKQRAMQSYGGF
jgi:hypothetical protein